MAGALRKMENEEWRFIYELPGELNRGTRRKPKYDPLEAQQYWNKRVVEIDEHIRGLPVK